MSERKQGYLWITLGYFERHQTKKTLEDVKRDKDSLIRALRRHCSKHGIQFAVYGCVASVHISKHKGAVEWAENGLIEKQGFMDSSQCPLHLHMLVWASAMQTIHCFIFSWWRNHGYGIERYNPLACTGGKKQGCMDCSEINPIDHDMDLKNIVRYIKRNYKYSYERCWIKININDSKDLTRIIYDM